MAAPNAPKQTTKPVTYRWLAVLLPALLSGLVLATILLVMRRPGFITNSPAFNTGGYLQDYSAQTYYQFLISLLGIVSGASFAAFLVGIRSVWYPYSVVRARNVAFPVINWLAAVTIVCFILSLFLVFLPVSEIGAFGALTALCVSFALLGYRSHWASGLPEELALAMESDTPLYELQSIDLDTSQIVSITDGDVHVPPPVALRPRLQQPRRDSVSPAPRWRTSRSRPSRRSSG